LLSVFRKKNTEYPHSEKVNNAGISGIGGVYGLIIIAQCEQDHIR
jgi:hypothetical protein